MTPDGCFRRVNGAWMQRLGYHERDLQGQTLAGLVHPDEVDMTRAALEKLAASGESVDFEVHVRASDGAYHWLRWTADLERGVIYAVVRDISAQRSQASYTRMLIESSLDAMMATDAHGVITDVNRQMELLTESRREKLIGSPFRDYVTEPERADDGIERTLRDGSVANLELIVRGNDGHETVLSYNATTFSDTDETLQGVFATARDITEFKEHALALEASNRELEAFSYSVSHDLRAPLRAIDGFTAALQRSYADQLNDDARDKLRRVRNATTKMSTLIDALLVLSRLSRQPLTLRQLDISALAREIGDELRAREPDRDVEFVIEDGLSAVADHALARTGLENLFENSWKFTGHRKNARIEFASAGERSFVVRDNGAGFDMAYADKLFVPFERLHRDDEFAGTGIGLATVQRVVNRNGGQLRGEGIVGEGAAFYFDLGGHDAADSDGAP